MIQNPIALNFDLNQVYECGAALLVLLACPNEKSEARLGDLHASLCGRALWSRFLLNPDDVTPITVTPQYVFRDVDKIDQDTKFVAARLSERLVAARMAIPFVQKAELGRVSQLPGGIKRLSINQMAEFVLEDAEQSDANNVERRYWVPSRPVIHLAAAAASVGQELQKKGIPIGLEYLLLLRELIEAIVRRAQLYEELIANDPKFPVKAAELTRVRLV